MGKVISDLAVVVWVLLAAFVAIKSDENCDPNVENMLEAILDPNDRSMQNQALRSELIRRVKSALQREELENQLVEYKKRNLESLARAGYIRTIPEDDFQRNLRSIQSLARNGELHFKREDQQDVDYDEDYDKRNIASLARSYGLPSYKRNVASLARGGMRIYGKRSQDGLLNALKDENQKQKPEDHYEDKRNLASIKAQTRIGKRSKRSVDYIEDNEEYSNPMYRTDAVDYEEILREFEGYDNPEKRFLGSVARTGWFRPSATRARFLAPNKRHIGSLARLGWLPTLRSARRFNRSGRSNNLCDDPRSFAANGQIQDYPFAEGAPFELMGKPMPKLYLQYGNE